MASYLSSSIYSLLGFSYGENSASNRASSESLPHSLPAAHFSLIEQSRRCPPTPPAKRSLIPMTWPPDPKSWLEYPAECLWYLMPGIFLHLTALLLSLIAITLFRAFKVWTPRITTILIFQAYLLLAAMLVNGVWSCAIWGHFYWSVDYTADFSVFYPITRQRIEYSWPPDMSGGLKGITLGELRFFWFVHAFIAWLVAFLATRWTIRTEPLISRTMPCKNQSHSKAPF